MARAPRHYCTLERNGYLLAKHGARQVGGCVSGSAEKRHVPRLLRGESAVTRSRVQSIV